MNDIHPLSFVISTSVIVAPGESALQNTSVVTIFVVAFL